MKIKVKTGIVLATALILAATTASAGRNIPDSHLALPVLVTLESGGGEASGFYLNDTNHFYLVTAFHVLFDPTTKKLRSKSATLLSYSADLKNPKAIKIKIDLKQLVADGHVASRFESDVTVVRIGKRQKKPDGQDEVTTQGKYVQWLEGLGEAATLSFPIAGLKKFDEVLTGNDIYLFGYPVSVGIKQMPQIEHDRPLLRKGVVAGKNQSKKTIILDCPIYYGNSGGPVAQVEVVGLGNTEFRVIGIVSQFVPFQETWVNTTHKVSHWEISNSGYSVVIPADYILELVQKLNSKQI